MPKKIKKVFPKEFKDLECYMLQFLNDSLERDVALRKLKEASLWAAKAAMKLDDDPNAIDSEVRMAEITAARRMKDKGYSNVAICQNLNRSEKYVRGLLKATSD